MCRASVESFCWLRHTSLDLTHFTGSDMSQPLKFLCKKLVDHASFLGYFAVLHWH